MSIANSQLRLEYTPILPSCLTHPLCCTTAKRLFENISRSLSSNRANVCRQKLVFHWQLPAFIGYTKKKAISFKGMLRKFSLKIFLFLVWTRDRINSSLNSWEIMSDAMNFHIHLWKHETDMNSWTTRLRKWTWRMGNYIKNLSNYGKLAIRWTARQSKNYIQLKDDFI